MNFRLFYFGLIITSQLQLNFNIKVATHYWRKVSTKNSVPFHPISI